MYSIKKTVIVEMNTVLEWIKSRVTIKKLLKLSLELEQSSLKAS